jgi:hypothetical protein
VFPSPLHRRDQPKINVDRRKTRVAVTIVRNQQTPFTKVSLAAFGHESSVLRNEFEQLQPLVLSRYMVLPVQPGNFLHLDLLTIIDLAGH